MPATYGIAGVGPPEFAKPSRLGVTGTLGLLISQKFRFSVLFACSMCVMPSFATDQRKDSNCPRSRPTPILQAKSSAIVWRSFQLTDGTGIEEIQLRSGETIRVKNWGCEYYVLTFSIEPAIARAHGVGVRAAYERAAVWLLRLKELHGDTPFNLVLAARALRQHYQENRTPVFGTKIPVVGDGTEFLQTQVQVEQPEENRKAGVLQFSLSKGPL